MRAFSIVVSLAVLHVATGCFSMIGDPQLEEVRRSRSPDGVVEAVLVRGNTGATDPYSYSVFLVPSGTAFAPKSSRFDIDRALFTADYEAALEVSWRAPKFLEIRYAKARIHRFTNFWQSQEVQNYGYVVELRLVPLDESSSLVPREA